MRSPGNVKSHKLLPTNHAKHCFEKFHKYLLVNTLGSRVKIILGKQVQLSFTLSEKAYLLPVQSFNITFKMAVLLTAFRDALRLFSLSTATHECITKALFKLVLVFTSTSSLEWQHDMKRLSRYSSQT